MKRKSLLSELKTYLFLGIKFGIVGSLIGFVLHTLWGNLQEIKYTIFNGFLIGFFVGFFELIFSNSKLAEKLGSKKYSSFLNDFFNDLDFAFTKTKGRVFQYWEKTF